MVTFRFYVVSTVAFFLALAVGVVLGSVLDEQIADSLRDQLDGVERSLDETVELIDEKNAEIERLESFVDSVAPWAVGGRVAGTTTLVVAESGVDQAVVDDLLARLEQGGSRVEGAVWLDPRWSGDVAEDREALAEALGAEGADAAELRRRAWRGVLAAAGVQGVEADSGGGGADPDDGTTVPDADGAGGDTAGEGVGGDGGAGAPTPTEPVPTEPVEGSLLEASPLVEMAEAGLVRLQTVGDPAGEGGPLRIVTVTGDGSALEEPGVMLAELVVEASTAGVPTVLAQADAAAADGEEAARGDLVTVPEGADAASVSTVDDLELLAGRVAVVLALAELAEGPGGRYGVGPDVDGILPRWQGP